ncbi:UNVERIFIED_ORG: G:T-mismatch repair DNA endonuclease (very short patch repair protein) [Rhizobium esperanzae]
MDRNVARDAENLSKLQEMGWQVLVIWECELRNSELVEQRIIGFLQT